MIDIYLVRHGEAAATWGDSADPGLSDKGRAQAAGAADILAQTVSDSEKLRLVSSPMARAQETAQPLAELLQSPIHIDKRFREVPSSVPLSERKRWLTGFMAQQWQQQAEPLLDWRREAISALTEQRCHCVVFTHFLLINAVVSQLMGCDDTVYFWPDNASISHLQLAAGELSLKSLGNELSTVVN